MKNIIAVTSGKGGAGKSTCSLSIAAALCRMGKTVLLIDLDAGLRCLDILTGVDEQLVFDLKDVLEGKELSDAILPCSAFGNLHLLAAPAEHYNIDGDAFARLLLRIRGFDHIILDFPAGTDFPFAEKLHDIADFLVISCADKLSMRDSFVMTKSLARLGCNCRLIINKYDRKLVKRGIYGGIDDIIDASGCRLLGVVPFDKKMIHMPQGSFKKRSLTTKAFGRIAKRIYGYEIPLPRVKKIQKGK